MNNKLPSYQHPPLVEVVIGTQFENIKGLIPLYLSDFWEKIGKNIFLEPVPADSFPKLNQEPGIQIYTGPQPARYIFGNIVGDSLIQLQHDRFIYNWKKINQDIPYPRYEKIIKDFYDFYMHFEKTLQEVNIASLKLEMLELTYVNIIPLKILSEDLGNISDLLIDAQWNPKKALSSPNGIDFSWWFEDKIQNTKMKIHVVSGQQREDGAPVIKIELSVRGHAPDKNITKCRTWFDDSHEWIVKAFDEITSENVHKEWEKNV